MAAHNQFCMCSDNPKAAHQILDNKMQFKIQHRNPHFLQASQQTAEYVLHVHIELNKYCYENHHKNASGHRKKTQLPPSIS